MTNITINDKLPATESIQINVSRENLKAFKEMVHRGVNLWPDAPPAIKEFADLLIEGKILQDYHSQVDAPSMKVPEGHVCAHEYSMERFPSDMSPGYEYAVYTCRRCKDTCKIGPYPSAIQTTNNTVISKESKPNE